MADIAETENIISHEEPIINPENIANKSLRLLFLNNKVFLELEIILV